jgi:hypothetical protein
VDGQDYVKRGGDAVKYLLSSVDFGIGITPPTPAACILNPLTSVSTQLLVGGSDSTDQWEQTTVDVVSGVIQLTFVSLTATDLGQHVANVALDGISCNNGDVFLDAAVTIVDPLHVKAPVRTISFWSQRYSDAETRV